MTAGGSILTVDIPAMGVGMSEAVILSWRKQVGDSVETGEVVGEIETDKSTFELESPATGVVARLLAEEGQVVAVGVTVVEIAIDSADVPSEAAVDTPIETTNDVTPPASAGDREARVTQDAPDSDNGAARLPHRLSPRARAQQASARSQLTGGRNASPRRATVARLTESWQSIPHFTVTREVTADRLLARYRVEKESLPGLTLTDLLLHGLAFAVANTATVERVDLGLAVATDRGVLLPVIPDVLGQDLASLAELRLRATERAREARLSKFDIEAQPKATLSNLGQLRVDSFTGVIPLGQETLLTVGQVRPRPIVVDGELAVGSTFIATLNSDHRALDGADAARVLDAFVHGIDELGGETGA